MLEVTHTYQEWRDMARAARDDSLQWVFTVLLPRVKQPFTQHTDVLVRACHEEIARRRNAQ